MDPDIFEYLGPERRLVTVHDHGRYQPSIDQLEKVIILEQLIDLDDGDLRLSSFNTVSVQLDQMLEIAAGFADVDLR